MYKIFTNKIPNVDDGIELYLDAGWGTADDYRKRYNIWAGAYKNSSFITAECDDKVVGIIRYLTDGFHDTKVIECVVLKKYQKMGIASAMMNKLKELYPQSSLYVEAVEQSKDFFSSQGFRKHKLVGMSYCKKTNI